MTNTIDEKNYKFKVSNIPINVKKNVKVEDVFEYYNKKTLTVSMDAKLSFYLYDYIPGYEEVEERISKIFNKHGFYYDFGSNWYLIAYEL